MLHNVSQDRSGLEIYPTSLAWCSFDAKQKFQPCFKSCSRMSCKAKMDLTVARARACVCVCVCVCVFVFFHRKGFSWLKQNNRCKCNGRDQCGDVVPRKSICVKYIHRHIIANHSRVLQATNCARVSIKPGADTRNNRHLLNLCENQR